MTKRAYSFPKSKRVRSRIEFSRVFEQGIRQSRGPLVAVSIPTDKPTARLGLSVPRRVGTAPKRNRIKRLIREAFRLMQHDFPRAYDLIVIVRPHEPMILAEYQRLLSALMVKLHNDWQEREGK
jgi:ribonuclease P protein component